MSPEQLLDAKGADASADLWALSVVAYQLMTGTIPFDGETFAALNLAICTGKFTPATQVRADLPAALDAFFARAFHIDVQERHATAAELATAYREACGMQAPEGLPPAIASERSGTTDVALAVSAGSPSVMSASTTVRVEPHSLRKRMMLAIALVGVLAGALLWWTTLRNRAPSDGFKEEPATAAPDPSPVVTQPDQPVVVPAASSSLPAPIPKTPAGKQATMAPKTAPPKPSRPAVPPKPDCRDPFFIDAKGIKRVRRECL
jgi:serine/threonine-protein kinase